MRVVREVVEGQPVGGKTHIALVDRVLQELLHPCELRWRGLTADGVLKPHHLDAEHRVWHQRHHVGAQRHCIQVREVIGGVVPGHAVRAAREHVLGDVLDPRKAIDDRILPRLALCPEGGPQRTVSDDDGGGAVTHYL